jgi:hypothetical protein
MSVAASRLPLLVVMLLLGNCRGTLPPTEPPRVTDEGLPETRTNDVTPFGPLAVDGPAPLAGTGMGGTSVLPPPPGPPGGGVGGAGGTAGNGIR